MLLCFQVRKSIEYDKLDLVFKVRLQVKLYLLDVFVGIFGGIHGQLFAIQVIIGVKFFEPEVEPEKVVVLDPAFTEGEL